MTVGKAWSDSEVAAAVALYFAMLGLSLNGLAFNKRAMIREATQESTQPAGFKACPYTAELRDRSRQSVEMKLMNVTACINSLAQEHGTNYQSMEFAGYKPLNSYQAALKIAVYKSGSLKIVNERSRGTL